MAQVTWLGDEDASKQTIVHHGHTFVKGEPTTIPEKDAFLGRFKTNVMFSVGKDADPIESEEPPQPNPDEGTELEAVRKDLDELGISYSKTAKLDTLRGKLADALG